MPNVILNLKRTLIERASPRRQIILRDKDKLKQLREAPNRIRTIPMERVYDAVDNYTLYITSKGREQTFVAQAVRLDQMHTLIGVQAKILHGWLASGKLPRAVYSVITGQRGNPPQAYLLSEVETIVSCLNSHHGEQQTFRHTDQGLINALKSGLTAARIVNDRKLIQEDA